MQAAPQLLQLLVLALLELDAVLQLLQPVLQLLHLLLGGEKAKTGLWGSTHGALPVRALLQAGAARNGVKKPLQKSFALLRRWEPGLECSACFGFPAGWICPLRC